MVSKSNHVKFLTLGNNIDLEGFKLVSYELAHH